MRYTLLLFLAVITLVSYIVFFTDVFVVRETYECVCEPPPQVETIPTTTHQDVMESISECESNGQHITNGEVTRSYTNDVGLFQVNIEIWGEIAERLNFNIYEEEGNREFAEWLYEKYQYTPWAASYECWSPDYQEYLEWVGRPATSSVETD